MHTSHNYRETERVFQLVEVCAPAPNRMGGRKEPRTHFSCK